MKHRDYEKNVRWSLYKRLKLFRQKSADYATDDALSNFKRVSQLAGILRVDVTKSYGTALFYALLKVDRLTNLLAKESKPQNESLQDTVDDLKNYIDLMEACLMDEGIL